MNGINTVLVVDDEESVRELICNMLAGAGYRVLSTDSGTLAVEWAQAQLPDLILLDFVMPGMSGVKVLEALRRTASTASIPVLLMSGMVSDESLFNAVAYGTAGYMMKPFTPSDLLLKVNTILIPRKPAAKDTGVMAQLSRAAGGYR